MPKGVRYKSKHELLKKGKEVLQGTSCVLLKLLKAYNQKIDLGFDEEIVGLRAQQQNRQYFNIEIGKVDKFTHPTRNKYVMKKERALSYKETL